MTLAAAQLCIVIRFVFDAILPRSTQALRPGPGTHAHMTNSSPRMSTTGRDQREIARLQVVNTSRPHQRKPTHGNRNEDAQQER